MSGRILNSARELFRAEFGWCETFNPKYSHFCLNSLNFVKILQEFKRNLIKDGNSEQRLCEVLKVDIEEADDLRLIANQRDRLLSPYRPRDTYSYNSDTLNLANLSLFTEKYIIRRLSEL